MFERLRAGWGNLADDASRFPAPRLGDTEAVREALEELFERDVSRFDAWFLRGRPQRPDPRYRTLTDPLVACGVLTPLGAGAYAPCVRITRLERRFLVTDLLARQDEDQVFPIMFEQVYTIRNMKVQGEEDVLELCVGSGVIGLFAADVAQGVTAVDISPRALAFARFNEALYPGRVPLDLREGSLFDPLETGRRFDHVLVNPPFEPTPPGASHALHSHGGEDCLAIVRAILEKLPRHLEAEGRFTMITWSPGDSDGPLVPGLVADALPRHRVEVHLLGEEGLETAVAPFAHEPGYAAWTERLAARGLERLHFVFLRAEPSERPGVEVLQPEVEVEACHAVADAWL